MQQGLSEFEETLAEQAETKSKETNKFIMLWKFASRVERVVSFSETGLRVLYVYIFLVTVVA